MVGRRSGRRGRPVVAALKYAYLTGFALFVLFPVFWLATNAFKIPDDIQTYPPVWVPRQLTLENFEVAVERFKALTALKNSLIVAGGSTVLALLVGTLAGYAMARFNTGGRQLSFWLLTQRMMPAVSIVFPSFVL